MDNSIKDKLLRIFFDNWCDTVENIPELYETIEKLSEHFQADRKDFLYIESTITGLQMACERKAYIDGFMAGVELVTGQAFR